MIRGKSVRKTSRGGSAGRRRGTGDSGGGGGVSKREAARRQKVAAQKQAMKAAWLSGKTDLQARRAAIQSTRSLGAQPSPRSASAAASSATVASTGATGSRAAPPMPRKSNTPQPRHSSSSSARPMQHNGRTSPVMYASTTNSVSATAAVTAAMPDNVLSRLSERISNQLRVEFSDQLRREVALEAEKKAEVADKLASYLDTELQSHKCPVCTELMVAPHRDPTLLFPCGHTFCAMCLQGHQSRSNTCPLCRQPIQSSAVNQAQKSLIETFAMKRSHYSGSADGGQQHRAPSRTLSSGGADVIRGATPVIPPHMAYTAPAPGYPPPSSMGPPPSAGGAWPGHMPAPSSAPPASAHDVDQATKYVHDYKQFSMRKQILQNELQDAAAATRDRNKRLAEVVANTDELARRRDRLSAQIQELQAQLDAVTRARAAEEEKRVALEAAHREAEESEVSVRTTIESLQSDMDKARLMVENFAPHLVPTLDGGAPAPMPAAPMPAAPPSYGSYAPQPLQSQQYGGMNYGYPAPTGGGGGGGGVHHAMPAAGYLPQQQAGGAAWYGQPQQQAHTQLPAQWQQQQTAATSSGMSAPVATAGGGVYYYNTQG